MTTTSKPLANDPAPLTAPQTINERTTLLYNLGNPLHARREAVGLHGLTHLERSYWTATTYIRSVRDPGKLDLSTKATKELWRRINDSVCPLRALDEQRSAAAEPTAPGNTGAPRHYDWGRDSAGRDIGDYTFDEFARRRSHKLRLTSLLVARQNAAASPAAVDMGAADQPAADSRHKQDQIGQPGVQTPSTGMAHPSSERTRREATARLKRDLYGAQSSPFSNDPLWDDVVPIPMRDAADALASISYTDEYAESASYLRAVMAMNEHSPRCLKLTETIVNMNPAHYTVWLYRFDIVRALGIPIVDELKWLNKISLDHLKNYQIWHHREKLLNLHFTTTLAQATSSLSSSSSSSSSTTTTHNHNNLAPEIRAFALSELDFIAQMLAQDAKNYHVWGYRQHLVRRLALWDLPEELAAVDALLHEDVRNNSAWAHRYFLVFSNPRYCTTTPHELPVGLADLKLPRDVVDRELEYAVARIGEAPMNQSAWNYLRGVITRGGREFAEFEPLCQMYVRRLRAGHSESADAKHQHDGHDEDTEETAETAHGGRKQPADDQDEWLDEEEDSGDGEGQGEYVRSTYALEMLVDIYAARGQLDKADLALARLANKWDRIRAGYWTWRRQCLAAKHSKEAEGEGGPPCGNE